MISNNRMNKEIFFKVCQIEDQINQFDTYLALTKVDKECWIIKIRGKKNLTRSQWGTCNAFVSSRTSLIAASIV